MRQRALAIFLLAVSVVASGDLYADKGKERRKVPQTKKSIESVESFTNSYYFQKSQYGNSEIERLRGLAKTSINEVDAENRYVEFLSPADLNRLPIGLKKKVGNTTVKIAVSSAVFTSRYAELTLYAKIDIPQNNNGNLSNNSSKTIFFGVKGLKLSKDGGIIGDAKLVLLGDYAIPINGNKSALVLKGGFNIQTGQIEDKTYVTIDCNGFKELRVDADVEFPRSLLIPTDAQGNQISGLVKGNFKTTVSNWNDIMANISLPAFEVKGLDGIGFKIDNAVVDLSDYHNSPDIVYPVGYRQKYLGNDETTIALWRGVYAKELRIILPKSFANRDSTNRVAFGSRDMVIDNNGLTGLFYSENIIPLSKGSAGGWQFSVDSFRIALEANRLLRAGFGGRIGLPVNKEDTITNQPPDSLNQIQRKKYLAYSAVMSATGEYLCRVVTNDSLMFDVWKAQVTLLPNSYIQLAGNKNAFKPSAMLHGTMDITSKTGTTGNERANKILDFKGITFQGLHIKTDAPYLSAQYFGYNGSIKIGNLPVSIDSIALKTFQSNELGLGFNLRLNLQDIGSGGFGGSTRLYVIGKYSQDQGLAKWKYDRLKIEDISLNAKVGAVSLNGTISFLDDDPKYGDGFKGNINMGVKFGTDSLKVYASAIFGNKGFRYWFVDGLLDFPGNGVPLGFVNINGFGGGAYYRMKKDGYMQTANGNTGVQYAPDSTAGLGLRASVVFNVASKDLDFGQATFEVGFNRGGGMRYIGFYGYAKIMKKLSLDNFPGGNMVTSIRDRFDSIATKMANAPPAWVDSLSNMKVFNPTGAAKQITSIPPNLEVDLRAILGINYDFNNRIFHANFDLYVSTSPNIISGVGPGGRAGWAVLHIEPSIWYLHMGTPTDPIGIKIGLGPISAQTTAYFMIGHNLPAFPPLPPQLQALMAQNNIQYQSNIGIGETNDIKAGKGIAFGAGVHVGTGDIRFLILYANFQAGMGFDVMVKDYSNYVCSQTNQTPGINGWYAQGRVYAYLQGECGVRIKLGPIVKKIPIIKGSAVAILEARLPKPSWFGGLFNINVRLLGNKIKINVNLKFSFGDECTLVQNNNGTIDFDEFRVVTSVTPDNNTQNVSLFAKPVINCLTAPEGSFNLPPDENTGGNEETFRPHISLINFSKGGQTFGCKYKLSSDSTKITVYPDSNFIAQTNYLLNVKIQYQKLVSGTWVNLTNPDGSPVIESTTVNFKTGDNPPNIPDENVGYMYPYKNQRFFYKNEVPNGKILLTTTRDELFNSFRRWKAKFFKTTGRVFVTATDVTYDRNSKMVSYPVPAALQANTAYLMEIYGEEFVPGGIVQDTTRPVIEIGFRTSNYSTLAEKITALQNMGPTPVVGRVESDVIDLQAKVSQYEGFEIAELAPSALTGNNPLISTIALLNEESYYQTKILPLVKYPNFYNADIRVVRDTADVGLIPAKAISLSSYYLNALHGGTYNTILYDRLPYIYDLNRVFNADFIELRNKIINKYLGNMAGAPMSTPMYEWYRPCFFCPRILRMTSAWINYFNSPQYRNSLSGNLSSIPTEMRELVTSPFPFMTLGDYKVDFAMRHVAGWSPSEPGAFQYAKGQSGVFTFHNPIHSTFFNTLQTASFTRTNCSAGETGGTISYSIPAGQFSSEISQADANQKAITALNQMGQAYANESGTCCVNGSCYVPGTVTLQLWNYKSGCYSSPTTVTLSGQQGTYTLEFDEYWYGSMNEFSLPAGTYTMTINTDNYYWGNISYTIDNPWQTWYGTNVYAGTVVLSGGSVYGITTSASCNSY